VNMRPIYTLSFTNTPRHESTLPEATSKRPVGFLALLALGINGIVGVGIFFAPADVARGAPGWQSIVIFAITGLALAPVAATFSVIGRRFDEDGGPVVYARAAFGDFASFLVGWIAYVSAVASTTAVMSGLTAAVAPSSWGPRTKGLAAACLATLLAIICAAGIRLSAWVWTALTGLKLVPLLALAFIYLAAGLPGPASPPTVMPAMSYLRAALLATFTFQGFEVVPVIAGQVRSSERHIPWAIGGALGSSALLYVALQAACVAALPALASSGAPLADAAGVLAGPWLARVVALGTSVSALGIAFGMVATTPRYLSALAAGGGSLPFDLGRVSGAGVPLRALFVTWLLVLALLQGGSLSEFFALSSVAVLAQYGATAVSLAALARRHERGLRPGDAWSALPTLLVTVALVSGAHAHEALVAGGALALGLLLRGYHRRAG
jgi:basic amino acid/polyamine antiporter, APA family